MKANGFTEEQIIGVLKEAEAGAKTKDLCRKYGISEATFYNGKAKYPTPDRKVVAWPQMASTSKGGVLTGLVGR